MNKIFIKLIEMEKNIVYINNPKIKKEFEDVLFELKKMMKKYFFLSNMEKKNLKDIVKKYSYTLEFTLLKGI